MFVGPEYSVTAGFTNALWIPVRPGTDTALLLGVAYSMITRDEDGSLINWDFLNRCTVGFDADHMPADATTSESFRDYVLGISDGQPKSQEWASEICGTPVELIDRFADINSCKNRVSFHSNSAPARCKGSENYPQLLMTIAAMGGHFGTPGNSCANDQYYGAMNSGILVHVPYSGTPVRFTNAQNPVQKCVSLDIIWDAIVDGEYWDAGNNFPGCQVHEPRREKCDIRVLISETNNFLASQANSNKGIEAFRKVGFVFASAYYMKVDAQYADVVVPVVTRWENDQAHLYVGTNMKDKELGFASRAPLPRLAECRTDREVAAGIAERLGMDYEAMNPKSDKQCWFEQITQSAVMLPTGPMPIAEVTEADLEKYGVEGAPQPGIMPFEQYLSDGVYRQERSADDAWANPMASPSPLSWLIPRPTRLPPPLPASSRSTARLRATGTTWSTATPTAARALPTTSRFLRCRSISRLRSATRRPSLTGRTRSRANTPSR
ncbi:MAG: molybdopterin-dependent oxidoreductase [Eggerthellaceae bacterium]|nr:molybdopterin-dependent oxidoreductase [Eggerthellaceae bacterium]